MVGARDIKLLPVLARILRRRSVFRLYAARDVRVGEQRDDSIRRDKGVDELIDQVWRDAIDEAAERVLLPRLRFRKMAVQLRFERRTQSGKIDVTLKRGAVVSPYGA